MVIEFCLGLFPLDAKPVWQTENLPLSSVQHCIFKKIIHIWKWKIPFFYFVKENFESVFITLKKIRKNSQNQDENKIMKLSLVPAISIIFSFYYNNQHMRLHVKNKQNTIGLQHINLSSWKKKKKNKYRLNTNNRLMSVPSYTST